MIPAVAVLALVVAADAEPPRSRAIHLQLGPIGVAAPILASYRGPPGFFWGASVGWRRRGPGRLALVLGLDLTHEVMPWREHLVDIEGPTFRRRGQLFSALPTLRIGAARRAFIYGLVGAGVAGHATQVWDWDKPLGRETDVGWAARVGFGAQALVGRRFAIGGEFSAELRRFRRDGDFADRYQDGFDNIADYDGELALRLGVVGSWGW